MPENPFKGRTVGKPRMNPFHTGLAEQPRNAFAGPQNDPRERFSLPPDMTRVDGTQKGRGYLGSVPDSQGRRMTEFSIGVGIDGREMEIPTLVPTLDPREIQYLQNMEPGMPIPPSIEQKAIEHARMRMRQGLSPFHDSGPSHTKRRY